MDEKKKLSPREEIKQAARAMLKRGERPSQTSVRQYIGNKSSNTTISEALKEFWDELGVELDLNESRPGVPDELFHMVREVWAAAVKKSDVIYEARKEKAIERETKALDAKRDAEDQLETMREKYATLAEQLDETKALLNKQQMVNAEQSVMLKNANKTISAKDEDIRKLNDQYSNHRDETDKRLTQKDDQIADLNRSLNEAAKENQQLTNSLAGARHQVTNLEKFKDLHAREQETNKELKANNDALQSEVRGLSDRLIVAQEKTDELRDRFDTRIDAVLDEAKADRETHAKEMSALTQSKAELQEQNDSLDQTLAERDAENSELQSVIDRLKAEIEELQINGL